MTAVTLAVAFVLGVVVGGLGMLLYLVMGEH